MKSQRSSTRSRRQPTRRAILKGALKGAAAAVGSGALTGFPTIWAQEIKNIELRHVGVSYSVVKAIGDQASKDLGFKVTMQNLDTLGGDQPLRHPAGVGGHRRRRRMASQARDQARGAARDRGQAHQRVSQYPAHLHQGGDRGEGGCRGRAFRPTRRCTSASPTRRRCTKASPTG